MSDQENSSYWTEFDVYIDFTSNWLRSLEDQQRREEGAKVLHDRLESKIADILDRWVSLPALAVHENTYRKLLVEARELFIYGYFYSCVTMCGVTAERILRDIFAKTLLVLLDGQPNPLNNKAAEQLESINAKQVTHFLFHAGIFHEELRKLFSRLGELRNDYTHGNITDRNPEKDSKNAIECLDQIIERTVSIFKDFEIQGGKLISRRNSST